MVRDGGILRGPTHSSCKKYNDGSPDGNKDCKRRSILAKPEQKPMPQRSRQPARILMRTERMAKLKVSRRPNLRPPPRRLLAVLGCHRLLKILITAQRRHKHPLPV